MRYVDTFLFLTLLPLRSKTLACNFLRKLHTLLPQTTNIS